MVFKLVALASVTPSSSSTSVMTGAQEFLSHFDVHSCCLEQIPEHHPQFMKLGAIRHMEHVIKCAQPGPTDGTLNILIRKRVNKDRKEVKG